MSELDRNENPVALAPAFVVLLGVCAAIYAVGLGVPLPVSIAVAVLVSAAWTLMGTYRIVPRWTPAFALILVLTLALSSASLFRMNRMDYVPSSISGEAKVLLARDWGRKSALLLETRHGRLAAYVPRSDAPLAGSLVWVRGAVFDLNRAGEDGGFDEFLFWRAKGAAKKAVLLECRELEKPKGLYRLRHLIRTRIKETLPERTAGYLLALTIGERTAELTALHKNAGTLHILAVSGFHVAMLAGLAGWLFRKGWTKVLTLSSLVWFYVLLAGMPPGGIRAALMLQVWLLSLPLGRPSRAFNNVSVAGVVLLLCEPWCFFDAGWRLSMLAALFLTASASFLGKGMAAAAFSPLVWLVTAPQSALIFGGIPLAGLFVNSVAVPFFSAIFPLVFALSLPSLAGAAWGAAPASVAEATLAAWELFSNAAAAFISVKIRYTFPLFALSAFIFCVAAMGASGFSKNKITLSAFILPLYLLLFA